MDTLRKGDQGTQVRQLQQLLVQRGCSAGANGTFDTKTWQALRVFQAQNLDQHGQPLVVDGVAGPLGWWSLQNRKPFIRVHGFSYVLSRMDKLPGFGHVP